MKCLELLPMPMAAVLLSGSNFCPKTYAIDAHPYGQRGQWQERAKEKLGLTDDQVQKIKAELVAEKDTLKGLITDLHEARTALREAIQAPGANETTVRAVAAKLGSVEANLAVERLKVYSRISPLLTSDQLDKLKQMRPLDANKDERCSVGGRRDPTRYCLGVSKRR